MSACLRSAVIDIGLPFSAIDDPDRSEPAVFVLGQRNQSLTAPSAEDRPLPGPVEMRSFTKIARRHLLPTNQPSSFIRRQGQGRDVVQRGLDRKQVPGN